jgi:hypothetical protein
MNQSRCELRMPNLLDAMPVEMYGCTCSRGRGRLAQIQTAGVLALARWLQRQTRCLLAVSAAEVRATLELPWSGVPGLGVAFLDTDQKRDTKHGNNLPTVRLDTEERAPWGRRQG